MTIRGPTSTSSSAPSFGPAVTAAAALSICESLLLALNECEVLPEHEIVGVLRDAAAAHANVPDFEQIFHNKVVELINLIIDGGNSVRHI